MSFPKVPKPDQAATSACAKNKEGPKPGGHVQLFRMERGCNKGFYSEKRQFGGLHRCVIWMGWVSCAWGCVTAVLQFCRVHRTACPTNTPVWTVFFEDKLFVGHGGGYQEAWCVYLTCTPNTLPTTISCFQCVTIFFSRGLVKPGSRSGGSDAFKSRTGGVQGVVDAN